MVFSSIEYKATSEIWEAYGKEVGTHKTTFFVVIKLFSDWFVTVENYKYKNINFIRNTFYDFIENYYFDLRQQNAQQSSEQKYQIEQKEPPFEQNAQQSAEQSHEHTCERCGSKFGSIQAVNGHKKTCKLVKKVGI